MRFTLSIAALALCIAAAPSQARFLQTDPVGYSADLNLYTYVQNDPANNADPTGEMCDGVGPCDTTNVAKATTILTGKAADAAVNHPGETTQLVGTAISLIPAPQARAVGGVVSGAGTIVKAIDGEGSATTAGGTTNGGSKGPDFIVTKDGAALRPSTEGNRTSLTGAGFPGRPTTQTPEPGTIHTVPNGRTPMDIRIMNGGRGGGPRIVTTRAGTNDPLRPNGEQFPSGTPRQERQDGSHIDLDQ